METGHSRHTRLSARSALSPHVGLFGRLWSPSSGVVSFRHSFLAFRVSVSPVLQPPAPWSLGSSVTSAPTGPPERTEVGGDKG